MKHCQLRGRWQLNRSQSCRVMPATRSSTTAPSRLQLLHYHSKQHSAPLQMLEGGAAPSWHTSKVAHSLPSARMHVQCHPLPEHRMHTCTHMHAHPQHTRVHPCSSKGGYMVSIFSCCIVNVENRYNNKAADTRTASAASASEQSRHKAPKQRQSLCIILLVHQIMGLNWWQGTVLAWMHRRGRAKVTHPLPIQCGAGRGCGW